MVWRYVSTCRYVHLLKPPHAVGAWWRQQQSRCSLLYTAAEVSLAARLSPCGTVIAHWAQVAARKPQAIRGGKRMNPKQRKAAAKKLKAQAHRQ